MKKLYVILFVFSKFSFLFGANSPELTKDFYASQSELNAEVVSIIKKVPNVVTGDWQFFAPPHHKISTTSSQWKSVTYIFKGQDGQPISTGAPGKFLQQDILAQSDPRFPFSKALMDLCAHELRLDCTIGKHFLRNFTLLHLIGAEKLDAYVKKMIEIENESDPVFSFWTLQDFMVEAKIIEKGVFKYIPNVTGYLAYRDGIYAGENTVCMEDTDQNAIYMVLGSDGKFCMRSDDDIMLTFSNDLMKSALWVKEYNTYVNNLSQKGTEIYTCSPIAYLRRYCNATAYGMFFSSPHVKGLDAYRTEHAIYSYPMQFDVDKINKILTMPVDAIKTMTKDEYYNF